MGKTVKKQIKCTKSQKNSLFLQRKHPDKVRYLKYRHFLFIN